MFNKLREKLRMVYDNDLMTNINDIEIEEIQEKIDLLMDYLDIEFAEDEGCEYCQGEGKGLYIIKR